MTDDGAATPSLTQFVVTPGVIDLSWGMPDPTLLPVEQLRAAANRALDRYGPAALAYGNPAGAAPLIEFITQRLAQTDARAPTPAAVDAGILHRNHLLRSRQRDSVWVGARGKMTVAS